MYRFFHVSHSNPIPLTPIFTYASSHSLSYTYTDTDRYAHTIAHSECTPSHTRTCVVSYSNIRTMSLTFSFSCLLSFFFLPEHFSPGLSYWFYQRDALWVLLMWRILKDESRTNENFFNEFSIFHDALNCTMEIWTIRTVKQLYFLWF